MALSPSILASGSQMKNFVGAVNIHTAVSTKQASSALKVVHKRAPTYLLPIGDKMVGLTGFLFHPLNALSNLSLTFRFAPNCLSV